MAGDFSDEEWDIPDDQWQALEHDAILSTQQQKQRTANRNGNRSARVSNQQLNDPSTERLGTSSILRRVGRGGPNGQNDTQLVNEQDSFDKPQLDEDGMPQVLEAQPRPYVPPRRTDDMALREEWRAKRYAQKHGPQPQSRTIPRQAYQEYQQRHQVAQNGPPAQQSVQQPRQAPYQPPAPPSQSTQGFEVIKTNPENETLHSMLLQLRQEKEALAQNLNQAQTELYTAKGEISLIRSKNGNELKVAERQMNILKKQLQEEAAKHRATVQAKEAAYTQLVTDSNFLKHELEEQGRRVQALQRQTKEKPLQQRLNDVNLSPRKGFASNLRDGFDDEEIMPMSPSKSPARRRTSKPNTPTKKQNTPTKKRKQPTANDLNVPSLALRLSGEPKQQTEKATEAVSKPVTRIVKDHRSKQHLQLLQDVMSFQPSKSTETIVECLVKHNFPSDPARPLSSILLAQTSQVKGERFAADLLDVFTSFLIRCHKEKYYKPLGILLETVSRILDLEPTIVDAKLITSILPPLQDLAYVNAKTRWDLADRNKVWDEDSPPRPKINREVSISACLEILVVIASLVVDESDLIAVFWKRMTTETVLLLLAPCQVIEDLTLTVELVATSIRSDSFGNICPADQQPLMERYILDKACYLLWDPPRPIIPVIEDPYARDQRHNWRYKKSEPEPAPPPPSRLQICTFRLKVLAFLSKVAMSSLPHPHRQNIATHHGTTFMLHHQSAIARLTRLLYDEVNNLYASSPDSATHALQASIINRATTILHHLLLSPQATGASSNFSLTHALSRASAGIYRLRVVLTRIAFREATPGGIDIGITEETAQRAHEVLEEYVTPEEAVQLLEAFGRDVDDDGDETMQTETAEAEVMAVVEQ